jgi:hypothetical protein
MLTFSSAASADTCVTIKNHVCKNATDNRQSVWSLSTQDGTVSLEAVFTLPLRQFLTPSATYNTLTTKVNLSKADDIAKCAAGPSESLQFVLAILIVVVVFTARCAIKNKLRKLARSEMMSK